MLTHLRSRILWSLAFAALVYFVLMLYADIPQLADALVHWDWFWLSFTLIAVLINYGLRFVRWHYYLRVLGMTSVAWGPSLLIFLAGFALTMVPGKLGELLKAVLLKARYDVPVSRSASIVAAERLTDVMGMVLLAALGISVFPLGLPALMVICVGLVCIVGVVQSRRMVEWFLQRLTRRQLLERPANLLWNLYDSAYLLLRWRPLLVAVALSLVAWFGECVALFLILHGFGLAATAHLLLVATFIYAGATLFGAATFTPGGLGTTEGSMTTLLQLVLGTSATLAAATTLFVRVCTLWFAVGLGAIALLILRGRNDHRAENVG